MDLTYLKQHYGRLETDELVRLQSTDLTEAAKTALEAELKLRDGTEDSVEKVRGRPNQLQLEQIDESTLAPLWRRFIAGVVDYGGACIVLTAINFPMYLYTPKAVSDLVGKASILVFFLYIFFKDGIGGQSFGKHLLKIRVLERSTREPCTLPRSAIRNAFNGLGFIDWTFVLGKESRRLGDHAAGTYVVKA